jgi:hypothetical protein
MHVDRRFLGWGAFFILVGAIPLAVRANLVSAEQVSRWPALWPLLLIGWGVGLVLRRTRVDWLGGAIAAVTFGLMGGGALATGFHGLSLFGGCGDGPGGTAFEDRTGTLEAEGRLNVAFNCGTLAIGTIDGSDWRLSGASHDGHAPRIATSGSTVTIDDPSTRGLFMDGGRAAWNLSVPQSVSAGLGVTLNAGHGTADLVGASLSSVSLTVNAGSFDLRLDGAAQLGDVNATVNAGSATVLLPAGDRAVNLSLNAGNLDVCVPDDAVLRVRWSGALGSNDLDDAGLNKVGDDTWVSDGFDETQDHLELHVTANAGSFGLAVGGTCDR